MNKPSRSCRSVASALLAVAFFTGAPVTAGLKSTYVGADRALADLGKARHQSAGECRETGCTGATDTGNEGMTWLIPPHRHQSGPAQPQPALSTATGE
jgi:hypothetical protein